MPARPWHEREEPQFDPLRPDVDRILKTPHRLPLHSGLWSACPTCRRLAKFLERELGIPTRFDIKTYGPHATP